MGTKYSSQSASGYNASPPSDDGTAVSTNEVKWSFIKTKLADSVKDLADNINSALVTHFDESVLDNSGTLTTTAAHHKRTINQTDSGTISLGDASTMAAGYIVTVKNSHTAANTVDLATGADTLDGTAAGSVVIDPNNSVTFVTNEGADGYYKWASALVPSKGADIASATALPTPTTAFADVTGTTAITSIATSGIVGSKITRQFDGILTLTHHATNLILPGGLDITTAAGDVAEFVEYASGDWLLTNYQSNAVEGTWTPEIWDNSLSGAEGQTYVASTGQLGKWSRNGKLITGIGHVELSSLGTLTTSEAAKIGGLPFTSANPSPGFNQGTAHFGQILSFNLPAAGAISGVIPANVDYINLYTSDSLTTYGTVLLSEVSSNGIMTFSFSYFID